MKKSNQPRKFYRTLFLSDFHLGTNGCQAEQILKFLKAHDADTYYLVGDIVDFWRLRKKANWPQAHNDVLQALLRKVRKGAHLYYIPGNHDEALRDYCGNHFGNIDIVSQIIHETADGRKFLVIHGDEFDIVVRYAKWLAYLGDWAYEMSIIANAKFNWVRRKLHLPYWSLSAWLKHKVKTAVNLIGEFETALATEARRQNVDGVICGHIHHVAITKINEIEYVNTGDWVESCTAIGETSDGKLEIIRWLEQTETDQEQAHEPKHDQPKSELQTAA
ncbi:MAG: UDP-2,3-diacylglucosamine diphosphatase [Rhizobiaceae bacterium]|nr:UDP-2,3-diacylglucosamine diphosphatase [Rhizobiaceae bacterium]